jgi:hypothetical protein
VTACCLLAFLLMVLLVAHTVAHVLWLVSFWVTLLAWLWLWHRLGVSEAPNFPPAATSINVGARRVAYPTFSKPYAGSGSSEARALRLRLSFSAQSVWMVLDAFLRGRKEVRPNEDCGDYYWRTSYSRFRSCSSSTAPTTAPRADFTRTARR